MKISTKKKRLKKLENDCKFKKVLHCRENMSCTQNIYIVKRLYSEKEEISALDMFKIYNEIFFSPKGSNILLEICHSCYYKR